MLFATLSLYHQVAVISMAMGANVGSYCACELSKKSNPKSIFSEKRIITTMCGSLIGASIGTAIGCGLPFVLPIIIISIPGYLISKY